MIFQTGLLRQLTEAGLEVSVVVPDKNDPNLVALGERDGVAVVQFSRRPRPVDRFLKTIRKYLVEDIRENPPLWDKHQELLGAGNGSGKRQLLARFGLFLGDVVQRFPALRTAFLRWEKNVLLRDAEVAFVRNLAPDLLVSTYPVTVPEPGLLLAAQSLGVPTVLHLLSWDNITAKGHFQALADDYIAWGPTMAEELEEFYGVGPQRITQCGVPHFDLYFGDKELPVGAGPLVQKLLKEQRPYLFFAMSAARYAPGETDILRQLCAAARVGGPLEGVRIVARPHPSALGGVLNDTKTLARLKELETDAGLLVSYPDMTAGSRMNWSVRDTDMYELVYLLRGAAVVLNSGSTVNVEALALGRPVVVTSFDGAEQQPYAKSARRLKDYPHLRKLFADGGGEVTTNTEELLTAITAFLKDPGFRAAERKYALQRQIGSQNGEATSKVARTLQELLVRNNEGLSSAKIKRHG
jgi:glycosyltransferase involved in cell wall biosynthesis